MLVTMVDDVRVALIKLAERTCAIRAVKDAPPEKRLRVAREVFDIYAPLAHRLGIGHIKWELEDLSFRYLHESAYKKIAKLLDEKRLARDAYVKRVATTLQQELGNAGIKADVGGAPSTSTASGERCGARGSIFPRSMISARCGFWFPKYGTAMPPSGSFTGSGATFRTSLMTISPIPRRTATSRCIRRLL